MNIVVATGVYAFLELPNFLHYRSPEAIAELFVREIREGIDDTGVKAAFLKCAVEEHGLVGDIPRILRLIAATAVGNLGAKAEPAVPALLRIVQRGRRALAPHPARPADRVAGRHARSGRLPGRDTIARCARDRPSGAYAP